MRPALPSLLALVGTMALAYAPPTAAASRATDVTAVLPGRWANSRTFAVDSVAPPESTVFLQFIGVCPAHDCDTGRRICPSDSVVVTLGGSLPNDCFSIRRVDLDTSAPSDLSVSVVVDDGACSGRACNPGRFPWERRITAWPLPLGTHYLSVSVIRVSCSDSTLKSPLAFTMPFDVVSCDSGATGCLTGDWHHTGDGRTCDATIAPGGSGSVDFTLRTAVALEGLQGRFEFQTPGLTITNVAPEGPAVNMRLAWAPTNTGAEFVLFSDGTGHIPAISPSDPPFPLLRVTLASPPSPQFPGQNHLYATELFGSTADGQEVISCPMPVGAPSIVFPPPWALICTGSGCDFNRDGSTDVRDLVLMVHCLQSPTRCALFDCDGDSSMTVDDVLCCAMKILRLTPCRAVDGCGPDSTPSRPDPRVRVRVGLPVETAGGADVPIHIAGADRVGAARLAFTIPGDRWHPAELTGADASWLTVVDAEHGQAVLGAIRISPPAGASDLDLVLHLEPVGGGGGAGGELGSVSADVSDVDGLRLIVPVETHAGLLPGRSIELSENRPDPFSGATRFTLSLPAAAAVDVGVYDLGGRRVATLHRGPLAAGVSEFSWDGRGSGGALVGGGVYFYRAVTGGRAVSKRMVYLGHP